MDIPIHSARATTSFAINPREVEHLARRYGQPVYRQCDIQADAHVRAHRWRDKPDRRGEVVFAIRQPNGHILLHTKRSYRRPIYRLPTGGIRPDEAVEAALYREIDEETGQEVVVERFLGILDCCFHHDGSQVRFPSYVFYLRSLTSRLENRDGEVLRFRTVSLPRLRWVAAGLRSLDGDRRCWGQWRALAHDLVYQLLRPRIPRTKMARRNG